MILCVSCMEKCPKQEKEEGGAHTYKRCGQKCKVTVTGKSKGGEGVSNQNKILDLRRHIQIFRNWKKN